MRIGPSGELNPGPLAPKARIIPLDHQPVPRTWIEQVTSATSVPRSTD